jgi:hypothetical protein
MKADMERIKRADFIAFEDGKGVLVEGHHSVIC